MHGVIVPNVPVPHKTIDLASVIWQDENRTPSEYEVWDG